MQGEVVVITAKRIVIPDTSELSTEQVKAVLSVVHALLWTDEKKAALRETMQKKWSPEMRAKASVAMKSVY